MLQSLYHSVCCFYKFCHWKGQFLAWLPLQAFKNPLIGSSLLENRRGKQASGFSFLEVGFHLESRKASYSRVFCHLEKLSSVISPTHHLVTCTHQLIQIKDQKLKLW